MSRRIFANLCIFVLDLCADNSYVGVISKGDTDMTIETLDQLFDVLRSNPTADEAEALGLPTAHGECDWTSLPTFGGDEPADTREVWSWDAGRMIVGSCAGDITIVDR